MGFKIDLEICGKSVECEAEIEETHSGDDYEGYNITSLVMTKSWCDSDIIGIVYDDDINKLIIDAYLESVGE